MTMHTNILVGVVRSSASFLHFVINNDHLLDSVCLEMKRHVNNTYPDYNSFHWNCF